MQTFLQETDGIVKDNHNYLTTAAAWVIAQLAHYPPGTALAVEALAPAVVRAEHGVDQAVCCGDMVAVKQACQVWMRAWAQGLGVWRKAQKTQRQMPTSGWNILGEYCRWPQQSS